MPSTLRVAVARWCRNTRIQLDITQRELADAIGVSRTYLAAIEAGRANPTLELIDRMGDALDTRFELLAHGPIVVGSPAERDLLHARCSGYAHRRLVAAGLDVAREVAVVDGRWRGWIDLLAFDRRSGTMFIVEIKTAIDDVGGIERQVGWYERLASTTEVGLAWRPTRIRTWLLVLATADADAAIARQRDALGQAFPARALDLRRCLADPSVSDVPSRGLALIDPRNRRREWLLPSRADGRRSPAPYADRNAAARAFQSRIG